MSGARIDPGQNRVDAIRFAALTMALGKREKLSFRVATDSMAPLIPVGAEIQIAPMRESPRRFDILVFWDKEKLVCHYLWSFNELRNPGEGHTYVTRALFGGEDLPIPQAQVLGRVTNFRVPLVTRFGIILRSLGR